MPKYETVTDDVCGWPYSTPYVYLRKIPAKKHTVKAAKKKRGPAPKTARDLIKPRRARKPKVTLKGTS